MLIAKIDKDENIELYFADTKNDKEPPEVIVTKKGKLFIRRSFPNKKVLTQMVAKAKLLLPKDESISCEEVNSLTFYSQAIGVAKMKKFTKTQRPYFKDNE